MSVRATHDEYMQPLQERDKHRKSKPVEFWRRYGRAWAANRWANGLNLSGLALEQDVRRLVDIDDNDFELKNAAIGVRYWVENPSGKG